VIPFDGDHSSDIDAWGAQNRPPIVHGPGPLTLRADNARTESQSTSGNATLAIGDRDFALFLHPLIAAQSLPFPDQASRMSRTGVIVDLHIIIRDGPNVLMGLRQNTGFADGMYHLPAGHLEDDETFVEGTIREAKEELGIDVQLADLNLEHVMHHTGRLGLFFSVKQWSGALGNAEPNKCKTLEWLPLDALPANTVGYARAALLAIDRGETISTFG
jgi:8-oxo-dGTP diphosphatase